jgi:nitrogen-specific signal transduction histidine kinase
VQRLGYAERVRDEDEKLRQIGQIGHELRNALSSVLAAAEILRRRCGDEVESEYDVITRQVARMRKCVDEMLEMTGPK